MTTCNKLQHEQQRHSCVLQFAMGVFSDLPAFEMQWLAQHIDGISLLGSAYKVTAICSFTMATYRTASRSALMASCCTGLRTSAHANAVRFATAGDVQSV